MAEQNTEELPGKFVRSAGDWAKIIYKHEYSLNIEEQALAKEIDAMIAEAERKEKALQEVMLKSLAKQLPSKFKVSKIARRNMWSLDFEADCWGLNVEALKPATPEKKMEQKPIEPECPYKALSRHHELKQILNCGVLTRAEKRKVLGLPEVEGD